MDSSLFLSCIVAAIGFLPLFSAIFLLVYRKFSFHPENSIMLSSVAPLSRNWKQHHVFPNFHGEDVRKGFLSHFLKELKKKGIDPFTDNDIERSKAIGDALIEAIRGSRIAIVLLSRNYASSTWCLNELVEIMKCTDVLGQKVMTIFYQVDPSDVKKQAGDFGKVFTKTCAGKTKEDIRKWRQALAKVATIAGYHTNNWDTEAVMIEKIATDISNKLNNFTPSRDFISLVGMEAHMENMKPLLCLESDEVRMIGIWGPSGIGKSTIARYLLSIHSHQFQLFVFMENIKVRYPRPCYDEHSANLHLQKEFLSQTFNQDVVEVPHLGVVQERLNDKKVLVILDDVDRLGQLDALAKETSWFGSGSRVLITTEDRKLLEAHGTNLVYKVDFPITNEALQILCMHAFGQKFPKDGFEELALEVTKLTGHLPLGLKIMGSYFRRMSKQEWMNALPKLRISINTEIESILKFSYDALDDKDKDLFLHIACFFNHYDVNQVEELLAKRFFDVRQGLNVLVEKSLICFSKFGSIYMHKLLEQLGEKLGKRQFLVDTREICEAFTDGVADSRSIIGIRFNISMEDKLKINDRAIKRMPNLQFLRIYYSDRNYSNTLDMPQGLKHQYQKLRLLDWEHCPMTCLPSFFNMEFLVHLSMCYSKLEKLWEGSQPLRNLKWIDLSDSKNLKELPNLSTATNLHDICLSGCTSLVKLPPSIGLARNLKELDLSGCTSLVELPSIENAKELNLSGCTSLMELPSSIGNVTNLTKLNLSGCTCLVELPSSIGNAINLKNLNLSGCTNLLKLPSSIGNATNLKELNLSDCKSLEELPSSIGNLHKLENLCLVGCWKLEALPININLKSLNELDLSFCWRLKSFPEISTNIEVLKLHVTAIEEVPLPIKSWSCLSELHISYFENLKELTHALDSITVLYFWGDELQIQELPPWVKGISRLRRLELLNCKKIVSLPQLPDSLEILNAEDCVSLERLECSFLNSEFSRLNFSNCFKLNKDARDLIIQASLNDKILGGVAVLPGGEVPDYFHYRSTGGSLIVKMNERPIPTSMRFKACIMVIKGERKADDTHDGFFSLEVWGERMWVSSSMYKHKSGYHLLPTSLTAHLYIFHIEAKDVTSSELVFEFAVERHNLEIGGCGVLQIS